MCDLVAAQLVGHEPHGFLSLTKFEATNTTNATISSMAQNDCRRASRTVRIWETPAVIRLTPASQSMAMTMNNRPMPTIIAPSSSEMADRRMAGIVAHGFSGGRYPGVREGGMLAWGFIGIFLGATLLAVAYELTREWISDRTPGSESVSADD